MADGQFGGQLTWNAIIFIVTIMHIILIIHRHSIPMDDGDMAHYRSLGRVWQLNCQLIRSDYGHFFAFQPLPTFSQCSARSLLWFLRLEREFLPVCFHVSRQDWEIFLAFSIFETGATILRKRIGWLAGLACSKKSISPLFSLQIACS